MGLTLFCNHSSLIKHLENEVEYLRTQMEHERQRAERAVDELLNVRVNVPAITQPTPRETMQRETVIEKLLRDSEFTETGE